MGANSVNGGNSPKHPDPHTDSFKGIDPLHTKPMGPAMDQSAVHTPHSPRFAAAPSVNGEGTVYESAEEGQSVASALSSGSSLLPGLDAPRAASAAHAAAPADVDAASAPTLKAATRALKASNVSITQKMGWGKDGAMQGLKMGLAMGLGSAVFFLLVGAHGFGIAAVVLGPILGLAYGLYAQQEAMALADNIEKGSTLKDLGNLAFRMAGPVGPMMKSKMAEFERIMAEKQATMQQQAPDAEPENAVRDMSKALSEADFDTRSETRS
jgi:hypothetical protein